jgi:hypothetical protein
MCFIRNSNSQFLLFPGDFEPEVGWKSSSVRRLFDNLHVGYIHTRAAHRDLGEVAVDLLKISGRQRDVEGSEVFGEVIA